MPPRCGTCPGQLMASTSYRPVTGVVLATWHIRSKNQSFSKKGYAKEPTHVPTFWPRPAEVRPCHLRLESPLQACVGRPRRGWFSCHQMREHVVSWAMGNHPASAWSGGGEPAQTPRVILLTAVSRPLSRYLPLVYCPPVL